MRTMIVAALLAVLAGATAQAGVLSPGLATLMQDMEDHEILKVLVVLEDQANVRSMDKNLHDQAVSLDVRHHTVIMSLRDAAGIAQQDLLADLQVRKANKAVGGVLGFTPHWIVNSIVLVAEVGVIREIALRDDVEIVEPDLVVELIEPVMTKTAPDLEPASPQDYYLAPGVTAVNAPRVWHELGFDGTGTLVANLDSGVDGNHEMLMSRWRGNFAPASECWRDHAGLGSPSFPADQHGHGTHTMGTITGGAGTDTIGVAPGALWIASNAVSALRNGFDNTIIAAFEFFADPDGDPTTMDDVPDVVQNSWGLAPNPVIGNLPCDSRYWDAIDNCEATGVVVTWSAGNEGPTKGSLRSPPDRATSPTNSFSIGSVGFDVPWVVSSFSSRGPSACGGEYALKPEVVAPGEDILSSLPNNNYGYMSGTSMAGPHVAGIVALMRQANPDIDVTDIKQILMDTAIDVGAAGEDNASGHGMVDAYAAVMAAMTDVAAIEGTVTDSATGLPMRGVEVRRTGFPTIYLTDADGSYSLNVRSGPTQLEFSKYSFDSQVIPLNLTVGETRVLDVALVQRPMGTVSGTVFGPDGQPVAGATVYAKDIPVDSHTTGPDGYYGIELPVFEDADYEIVATAMDLAYVVSFIGLPQSRVVDFHLPYIIAEGFESGTLSSFPWETGGRVPMRVDFEEAYEGIFSVRSGDIGDSDTSELSIDYHVVGDGEFSFFVKTECESGYDGLIFYLDGNYMGSWSGEEDWLRFSTLITSGQHNFKWVYSKDYAVAVKRDAVWIDRIEFPGTGVAPEPRVQIDQTSLTMNLNPEYADSLALSVANIGGYRLDFAATVLPDLPGDPSWATVTPASGWIHPGVARDLVVVFDAQGLAYGVHHSMLEIATNDPTQPVRTVPLVFTVGGVSAVGETVLPARMSLSGAVPNPFNPMTHVTFSLPEAGEVSLRVYDVSGRLVRDLVSGPRSAGLHRERWDGRDQAGLDAASGVYFARLSAGGHTQMKSMLLLR